MKIGFAKADLTDVMLLKPVNPGDRPADEPVLSDHDRRFLDISDKMILRIMNENRGIQERIAEPLTAAVMYGEDITGPWAVISFDLCESGYRFIDDVKEPVSAQLGIPKDRIIVLFSHVHVFSGLTFKKEFYTELIPNTVNEARSNSEESEMAVVNLGMDAERFIMNRRVTIDGIGARTIMFNDDCEVQDSYVDATCQIQKWIEDLGGDPADYLEKDAEIRSDGPIDNSLDALFFRSKETGRMIGSFVHFACHPVIVSQLRVKGEISPDYPGFLKKKIEQELGGVAVFGNGACGDIKPLNAEYSQSFARSFGEKLAAKLINAFPEVEWKPLSMVELLSEPVSVPIRDDFPATVEEAEKKMEALNSEYDRAETPFERRKLQNLNRIYAFAAGGLINDLRPEWIEERKAMFPLYAIKLNDTAIVISNGEIFTRTGQAIIEPYKDKKPLLATVANETLFYVLPAEEFENGGYEYGGCMLAPGADRIITGGCHKLLKRVYGKVV